MAGLSQCSQGHSQGGLGCGMRQQERPMCWFHPAWPDTPQGLPRDLSPQLGFPAQACEYTGQIHQEGWRGSMDTTDRRFSPQSPQQLFSSGNIASLWLNCWQQVPTSCCLLKPWLSCCPQPPTHPLQFCCCC
ncbi:uncharacterized protein ACIB01_013763 [Guaruba guarouba]